MSIYLDSSIGTDTNRIVFNDYGTSPVYRLQSRQPQRRDIRELDVPVPYESGISDFETLIGQTVYVLEGTMYPGSESEHAQGLAALRKLSSLDIAQDDVLSDDGYVPYAYDEFGIEKQIYMKVLYVQLPESTRQGLVQPFRLICKVKDPTIFLASQQTANTTQAEPSTASGTSVYPFTYATVYGASTYSVTADALNSGDIAVYPISIRVRGPLSGPRITNTATGEFIRVSTTLSTDDDELLIVYDKDSLSVTNNGVSVLNQVTDDSTYWKLQPGSNPITLTADAIADGAFAEVAYRSGWPLS